MPFRADGLKPGEVARAKRVAKILGPHIPRSMSRTRPVRNIIARLKRQNLRIRDFDTPNGGDAIAAIVSIMTHQELHAEPPPLGRVWELVASRALQIHDEHDARHLRERQEGKTRWR